LRVDAALALPVIPESSGIAPSGIPPKDARTRKNIQFIHPQLTAARNNNKNVHIVRARPVASRWIRPDLESYHETRALPVGRLRGGRTRLAIGGN
jgi:hypothetical protein